MYLSNLCRAIAQALAIACLQHLPDSRLEHFVFDASDVGVEQGKVVVITYEVRAAKTTLPGVAVEPITETLFPVIEYTGGQN